MGEGTTTSAITTNIGKIAPAITQGFTDIITGCINLAVALVPIALGYIAVVMVIKKGKSLMKI